MIGRLNHVAIAVPDLEAAAATYRDVLGARVSAAVDQPEHGVRTVFVELPNTKIELLGALGERLADRGLPRAQPRPAASIMSATRWTTSRRPATGCWPPGRASWATASRRIGAHGKPVLFLHPKDMRGTLVELEQA